MTEVRLDAIADIIQEDVGNRGLRTDAAANLVTACAGDLHAACRSLAETPEPAVAVVTGFFIPHADPPCGETDGPLGAVFLARALVPLGMKVVLATDPFCVPALEAGLAVAGLGKTVTLVPLPAVRDAAGMSAADYWTNFTERAGHLTHLIALERVGPSHTPESVEAQPGGHPRLVDEFVREVPAEHYNRCHTMKGRDITARMSPAHLLFEAAGLRGRIGQARQEPRPQVRQEPRPPACQEPPLTTIGIGDGGNEIGMGKVPWEVIRRNIPGGARVACRVPTDYLIVCGVSNWGAYGLAAGTRLLRGEPFDPELFDPERERELLRLMVERGPLVDGVSGQPTVSVDGLDFDRYAEPLHRLRALLST